MNLTHSNSGKRIVILGHGALGIVFGVALQRAGHEVIFLGRSIVETESPPPSEIAYRDLDGALRFVPITVTRDPAVAAGADLIIVLVKTPDTGTAGGRIAPYISAGTPVVSLQNGFGAAERVQAVLGENVLVISGVTSQAATRHGCCSVTHTGAGPTLIGSTSPHGQRAARGLAALFSDAGIPTLAVESIEHEIWQKAAINAAINGVTALCEVENGAIAIDPELQQVAREVAAEVTAVAAARGISLADIEKVLTGVAVATARNRSSMLQDLDAGRMTEVDAIYGEVQRAAGRYGVATPRIDALSALIEAKSRAARLKENPIEPDA